MMSSSAFIGSTMTHLRGLGLGSEVDDDELERGDAIRLAPEPSNPRDPNAVTVSTPKGLLIGRINKRHADAGFSRMLGNIASQNIEHRATILSLSPLPSWGGDRHETSVVRITISFFGPPLKVPLLRRLVKHHGLHFHEASVDASTPNPAEAGAGAGETPVVVAAGASTMPSAGSDPSQREAHGVIDLTMDSD